MKFVVIACLGAGRWPPSAVPTDAGFRQVQARRAAVSSLAATVPGNEGTADRRSPHRCRRPREAEISM